MVWVNYNLDAVKFSLTSNKTYMSRISHVSMDVYMVLICHFSMHYNMTS
jgi:hypothetical protein